jgi:hypothetical protein
MPSQILDHFEDLSGWTAITSGEAQLTLSSADGPAGKAMRLDFDFCGGGGFVVARRNLALELPQSYSFGYLIRGQAPANIFEFKLVDESGQNVWRYRVEEFRFPADWQPVRIRDSQIEFAWGPLGGGPARHIAAIEMVIAAGPGGKGTVEFADLSFQDDTYRATPVVRASSALPGYDAQNVMGGSEDRSWRCAVGEAPQWLLIDFQQEREYGGLVIHWEEGRAARDFEVQLSTDGQMWKTGYATRQGGAERSYVFLPQAISRYVRLNLNRSAAGQGFGIRFIDIEPFDFSRSLNAFFEHVAKRRPAGLYPKYLLGRQSYWTPVGTGADETQALFNQEGMIEVDKGSFSIEPFLYAGGRLVTWADVTLTQGLEQGYLPIPWSQWQCDGLVLRITAFAGPSLAGDMGQGGSALFIRYGIQNTAPQAQSVRFFAAIRPFQVTPTWQHWRAFGGVAEVRALAYRDGAVRVNGNKGVIPLRPAAGFGAAAFAEGAVTEYLATGELPPHTEVADEFGYASGALRFDLDISPGAAEEVVLAVPFGSVEEGSSEFGWPSVSAPEMFQRAVRAWEAVLNTATIRLPEAAQELGDAFKTAAAHILINRDGPALHPGPRRYNRSWIRDGVLMGAALLRVGCTDALRDFMRWYAQFQTDEGDLPDCADREGTEWLPEFDAYGEFVYGVMEYWRFTGDTEFVREMQPAVWKTLGYMEKLRARRLTPEYQTPDKQACFGLLPESMSHEGYMAHPVHAYWDDFWALRGLKDAAVMADILGDTTEAERLKALRDEFCKALYASMDATIARHGIDFVPGSVEFGDFDPAATAIALSPIDETHRLPESAIHRTFDKYLEGFRDRARGKVAWNNYSAYEIRIVGALVRLGRRRDALEVAGFMLEDRRIRPWNQWPEISWRDPSGPSFIGDLPHTWISGEYILAVRSLFAYEREADDALVIAAGIDGEWLADGSEVAVENLPTWYGQLSYTLRLEGADTLRLFLDGDLTVPPGGIVVQPPLPRPILAVEIDGREWADFDAMSVRILSVPADVVVRF